MTANDEYADFREHAAKANEHALMAAQVYHHQETTEEANYWMLNAIFDAVASVAALLQVKYGVQGEPWKYED